jgi:nitroimidazol reductase NimA-like FMN-containing flavoprotein (pyridoxamine 5'-phosphate oxidase superfamily)
MIGVMTDYEVEALLGRQRIGRIACSTNDRPYVVPITYAYDGTYVYAYSGLGRKIDVMREQPLVCFEVDEVDGDASWRCVVAEGVYEELTEEDTRHEALARLAADGAQVVPRSLNGSHRLVVFRIRLTERSGRFERRDA